MAHRKGLYLRTILHRLRRDVPGLAFGVDVNHPVVLLLEGRELGALETITIGRARVRGVEGGPLGRELG